MLGGPEFQRRVIAALDTEIGEQLTNLMLAKEWPDFMQRRGTIRGLEWARDKAHEIIKQMEGP